ncbi:MAG: hypothetical protein E7412_00860 [Ruminococcaceae bacterium]|nr:hypothetical protein [Oscillospiraceae bacterium]
MHKQLNERDKRRISLIFTLILAMDFINYMIGEWFDTGGMIFSLALLGAAMLYSYKTIIKIKISPLAWAFMIYVILLYVTTRQVTRTTLFGRVFMFSFLAVSILAMYKCDTEKLLRYMSYVSLFPWLFYNDIFVEMTSTQYNTGVSLGLSYAIFPLLVAPIFHFCFYRKQAKKYMYILYALAVFLLVNLMLKGNRGIMVSAITAAALIFIRGGGDKRRSGASMIRIVIVAVVAIICVANFYEIVEWAYDYLNERNINANFFKKILSLQKRGDISNGRNFIYEYTIKEIFEKPFWGHGISTIFDNSGGRIVYPHNLILQLFYDGGAVLAIPVSLVICSAVAYAFIGEDREEALFSMFLLVVCLPRAMFSADIWRTESLWLFVLHSMKYHQIRKERKTRLTAADAEHIDEETAITEGATE